MIYTDLEEEVEEFRSNTETAETFTETEESDHSVESTDLFNDGTDKILLEGEIYKFKPGLS